ncbi:hypothetical protein [Actinokineospora sp. NBRC 105648]|uniref:hypothetical protein n=1 Tax=Actinokineospora sp. NBRC 105648 TaxID=3032206 RepID=UPI0024A0B961|nr:hypothetical protein [Actinokineospora sp. NBRC 105648]GLZ41801.1 hypothetical protein Acsp05_54250 [Actinokineospora sp. NBRC 105648]
MRIRRLIAASAAALFTAATLVTPAPAEVTGTWACSVPAGYTYTSVTQSTQCGSGGNTAPRYYIEVPANNLWACTAPSNLTYIPVTSSSQCSTISTAPRYYLRTPQNNMWACSIPSGYTYSQYVQSSECSTIGTGPKYLLVKI